MKIKLTILFLAIASVAFAQKKEMRKIEKAIQKGDFVKAQEVFSTIDENSVEEKYAANYQFYKAANMMDLTGIKKVGLEDLRKAEATLAKAKELGFDDKSLLPMVQNMIQTKKFKIADERIKSGDSESALELVEELYESDPLNYGMLYQAGNIAYSNQMYDKALEKYNILLKNNYTGEITSYLAANKKNGTIERFSSKQLRDVAIKFKTHENPASEKSPSSLGDIVLKTVWLYNKNKGDLKNAKAVYDTALKNHPNDASLKLVKADVFLTLDMMDEYKDAIENVNSDISDPKVFDNLGTAAIKDKNYESAIRYFSSSLKLEPKNYFALVNLSNAYLETGNLEKTSASEQKELYAKAVSNLENAHKLKPEEKAVMATLVSLYDFLEMTDKSVAMKAKM